MTVFSDNGPKPPVKVSARARSASSILVSWEDSPENVGLKVQWYVLKYFVTSLGESKAIDEVVNGNSRLIEALDTNTSYSVFIRTYAGNIESKPSETVTVVTANESQYSLDQQEVIFQCCQIQNNG